MTAAERGNASAALPDAGAPRHPWVRAVLLVMAAAAVSQGFTRFAYAFVLPDMTEDVLGSYSVAGALGAANLGGYLVGVLAMTAFAHRFESTRLFKCGLTATVIGLLIVATAPTQTVLFLGMTVAGTSSAAVWIPCASIVTAYAPPARRGLAFGLVTAGIGIAIAASGRITVWVDQISGPGSWRQVWLVIVVISAVVLALQLLFLKPVGETPGPPARRVAVRGVLPGAVTLFISYGLYGVSFALYTNYLIAALQDSVGYTMPEAAGVYSLLGLASIVGGVLLGRVSDAVGRRAVLAVAMVVVGLAPLVVVFELDALVLASTLLYGLLMTGIGSVVVALMSDVLDPQDIGAAFGAITLSLGAAQLISPPIGGWLADTTGSFAATFLVAAIAGVAAGVVAMFLPQARRGARPTVPPLTT